MERLIRFEEKKEMVNQIWRKDEKEMLIRFEEKEKRKWLIRFDNAKDFGNKVKRRVKADGAGDHEDEERDHQRITKINNG